MFEFVLGVKSIEGTYLDYRIKQVVNQGTSSNTLYKPRSGTVNSNLSLYTDDQLAYIKKLCREQLLFFGYVKDDNNSAGHFNKNTEFFEFSDLSEKEAQESHGFL